MKIDTMTRAITCKKMIRAKIDLNRIRLFHLRHKVPDTAYGVDCYLGAMLGKLLTQTMDIDFNGIGCDLAGQSEEFVLDQLLRHDAILAPNQEFEHRCFTAGQDLRFTIDEGLPAFSVKRDVTHLQRTPE